jgi:hypothetical protein
MIKVLFCFGFVFNFTPTNQNTFNMKQTIHALFLFALLFSFMGCKKDKDDNNNSNGDMEHTTSALSVARYGMGAADGMSKVYFAGGLAAGGSSKIIDIYDVQTNSWTTKELSVARHSLGGTNIMGQFGGTEIRNAVFFAGGLSGAYSKEIDIFDEASGSHTTAELSEPSTPVACAASDRVFFVESGPTGGYKKSIDIHNMSNLGWSDAELPAERFGIAAAATSTSLLVAGGSTGNGSYTGLVEIYNVLTGNVTSEQLSEARTELVAARSGNIILFAGGFGQNGLSKTVDIYNAATNNWSTAELSEPRNTLAAVAAENKIFFAGGETAGGVSKTIDIYDTHTGKWTTAKLSEARAGIAAATAGKKVVFAGGYLADGAPSKTVDIFTLP